MACSTLLRLYPAAGALKTKLQQDRGVIGHEAVKRNFSAESHAAFARELQRRIAAAQIPSRSQRTGGAQHSLTNHRELYRWHRHNSRHRISKLLVAAAGGAFALGLLRRQRQAPETQEPAVYQGPEASAQQEAFDLPELQPGDLHVCISWLENRRALLEAEQTALHALPPVTNQMHRLKELQDDLHSSEVIMSALLTTLNSKDQDS